MGIGDFYAGIYKLIFWGFFWSVVVGIPFIFFMCFLGGWLRKHLLIRRSPQAQTPSSWRKKHPVAFNSLLSLAICIWLPAAYFYFDHYKFPYGASPCKYRQDSVRLDNIERATIDISLLDDKAYVSSHDLAATCAAAARYYTDQEGYETVKIRLSDFPYQGNISWGDVRVLAECSHSPSGQGWYNGDPQGWTWENFTVANSTLPETQRIINKLWVELSEKFRNKSGILLQDKLGQEISRITGIPANECRPERIRKSEVFYKPFVDIQPKAPENRRFENLDTLRLFAAEEIRALLHEFDSFRDRLSMDKSRYNIICANCQDQFDSWQKRVHSLEIMVYPKFSSFYNAKTAAYRLGLMARTQADGRDIGHVDTLYKLILKGSDELKKEGGH